MSSLLVPKEQPIIHLVVKRYGPEMFNRVLKELALKRGRQGQEIADRLMAALMKSVGLSFVKAPMNNVTEQAVSERLDKAMEICLRCLENKYPVVRIEDELPSLLLEEYEVKETQVRRDRAWGVEEEVPMLEHLMLEETFDETDRT